MIRADMIGPRRIRPASVPGQVISTFTDEKRPLEDIIDPISIRGTINGVIPSCHEAPIPQPALVIRDDLLGKSEAAVLAKAIQAHVEAMAKAETRMGSGLFKWPPTVAGERPPVDVSTPQHEHARLVAKKQYLESKLDAHQRSGHTPETNVDMQNRQRILGQVHRGIANLESQGVKSGPEHHRDWMNYYAKIHLHDPKKAESLHPDEANTALSAHTGVLKQTSEEPTPQAKQKKEEGMTARRLSESPQSGAGIAKPSTMMPFGQYTRLGGDPEEYKQAKTRVAPAPSKEALEALRPLPSFGSFGSSKPSVAPSVSESTKAGATGVMPRAEAAEPFSHRFKSVRLFVRGENMSKAKSDDWISNKISILRHEGYPQKQAIAIAYSMAKRSKKKKAKKSVTKSPALIVACK